MACFELSEKQVVEKSVSSCIGETWLAYKNHKIQKSFNLKFYQINNLKYNISSPEVQYFLGRFFFYPTDPHSIPTNASDYISKNRDEKYYIQLQFF